MKVFCFLSFEGFEGLEVRFIRRLTLEVVSANGEPDVGDAVASCCHGSSSAVVATSTPLVSTAKKKKKKKKIFKDLKI